MTNGRQGRDAGITVPTHQRPGPECPARAHAQSDDVSLSRSVQENHSLNLEKHGVDGELWHRNQRL